MRAKRVSFPGVPSLVTEELYIYCTTHKRVQLQTATEITLQGSPTLAPRKSETVAPCYANRKIAASISELPEACGSYSYDFSYWYDEGATPPPTAQESSPVTPDDPLGLPEDSATAAPTAESDGTLGRRLARVAAACALAALLL